MLDHTSHCSGCSVVVKLGTSFAILAQRTWKIIVNELKQDESTDKRNGHDNPRNQSINPSHPEDNGTIN